MTASTFVTDEGIQVPAVTAEQMREVDRVAIQEVGPNLYQMMENAGRSLALTVLDAMGGASGLEPVVVLAGTGGNGGGGICAGRHLANRGVEVTVVLSDSKGLKAVPEDQLSTYRGTGGRVASPDELDKHEAGVVVDAIIGYSLRGAPRDAPRAMIEWTAAQTAPVISLDVPSGIDATSGRAPGAHVLASATLTLALPKTGLDVAAVGDLFLADIGIPRDVYRRSGIDVPAHIFGERYRASVRPG